MMKKFQKGINIGGWLSQYESVIKEPLTETNLTYHFNSFITEEDIRQIASWGFDHIRMPVSGYLLYEKTKGQINEEILSYIDRCVLWCDTYKLNMVLDLHDLWGNIYGAMDKPMPLLTDENLQENFFRIWEQLATHFKDKRKCVIMFELLNEVSDSTGYLWNQMYQEAVRRIRNIDPYRPILVGSNCQNSVAYLKDLKLIDDPLVFYNFHYYEPQVFTHQKARFSEEMNEFNHTITYPGDISEFVKYLEKHPQYYMKYALTAKEMKNDRALMEKLLENACSFIKDSGRQLYCGEFGVIDYAPPIEAAKWIHDLIEILDTNGIGHAMWNYKCLHFGLLDRNGHVVSEKLKKAVIEENFKKQLQS